MARYKVRRGELPSQIAKRYGISVQSLLRANPGVTKFSTGMGINIPRLASVSPVIQTRENERLTTAGGVRVGPNSVYDPKNKPRTITALDRILGRSEVAPPGGMLAAPIYNTSDIPSASFKVNPSMRPVTFTSVGGNAGGAAPYIPGVTEARSIIANQPQLGPLSFNRSDPTTQPKPLYGSTVLPGTLNIRTPSLFDVQGQPNAPTGQTPLQILGLQQSGETSDANAYRPTNALSRKYAEYGGDTSTQIVNQVASQLNQGNFPSRLPIAQASALGVVQDFLNLGYRIESGALVAPQGGVTSTQTQTTSNNVVELGDNAYRVGKNFGARGDKWRVIYRDGAKITVGTGRNRRGGSAPQSNEPQMVQQDVAPGFGLVNYGINWRV